MAIVVGKQFAWCVDTHSQVVNLVVLLLKMSSNGHLSQTGSAYWSALFTALLFVAVPLEVLVIKVPGTPQPQGALRIAHGSPATEGFLGCSTAQQLNHFLLCIPLTPKKHHAFKLALWQLVS